MQTETKATTIGEARQLAYRLFNEHGLHDWKFQINHRTRRRLGCCKYREKIIEVSAWVFEKCPEEVDDTVRHEVAHVLAGPKAKHGPLWREKAILVGAKPDRTVSLSADQKLPPRWLLKCPGCGTTGWGSQRKRTARYRSRCCKEIFINIRNPLA